MKGRKYVFASSVLAGVMALLLSCSGGSSNNGKVCDAAFERVFELCDQNDPEDVVTIQGAYASVGISITEEEIQAATQEEAAEDCKAELDASEEVEITDEDADDFVDGLSLFSDCEGVASYIVNNVNSL